MRAAFNRIESSLLTIYGMSLGMIGSMPLAAFSSQFTSCLAPSELICLSQPRVARRCVGDIAVYERQQPPHMTSMDAGKVQLCVDPSLILSVIVSFSSASAVV